MTPDSLLRVVHLLLIPGAGRSSSLKEANYPETTN